MKNTTKSLSLLTLLAALTSCGSSGVSELESAPAVAQTDGGSIPVGNWNPLYAPYTYRFQACGAVPSDTSGLVSTDNVLNIRVKAEPATQNGCYSTPTNIPYSAAYNCARFNVTMQVETSPGQWIDRVTVTSPTLKVPGTDGCSGAQTEAVFNMTNYLFPGHGLVRFKISDVQTSHFCDYYKKCKASNFMTTGCSGYRYYDETYFCPLKPIYQYHKAQGTIEVQTDVSYL